jgi:hypothetical protein
MRALQKELDELRRDKARARENEDELEILRERCERLERERGQHGGGVSLLLSLLPPPFSR